MEPPPTYRENPNPIIKKCRQRRDVPHQPHRRACRVSAVTPAALPPPPLYLATEPELPRHRCPRGHDAIVQRESTGYTQRYQSYDPNNGIRARLPLCNPNPNRVKAKKRDRGWRMSLEPDHHRHRAGEEEHRRPHRRATRKEQILVRIRE